MTTKLYITNFYFRHDTLGDYNITLDVVVYSYVTMVVTWSPPELTLRHTKFLTADVANVPCPNLVAPGKCVFYHRVCRVAKMIRATPITVTPGALLLIRKRERKFIYSYIHKCK